MRTILCGILVLGLISATSFAEERTFYLNSGDKITGEVMSISPEGTYTVKTSFGLVTFHKDDIKPEEVIMILKNGDKVKGKIIEESDTAFKLKSSFGEITVTKAEIDKVDFQDREEIIEGVPEDDSRWYYGDEQLIDIWFDPVGFTLAENQLYLSGLSWAYGLTDNFQLSSKWWNYVWGDLNLRPKYMLFKHGDINRSQALSIGGHFHLRALPNKYDFRNWTYNDTLIYQLPDSTLMDTIITNQNSEWIRVGSELDGRSYNAIPSVGSIMWYEVFGSYTISTLRNSGQGRINYTFGTSITWYPDDNMDTEIMPRAWIAVDADARRNLKFLFEIFYDPYYVPWINFLEDEDVGNPVFLDFGFVYSYNNRLRIGVHFQKPFIALYYKF